jgi:hypothetical protein
MYSLLAITRSASHLEQFFQQKSGLWLYYWPTVHNPDSWQSRYVARLVGSVLSVSDPFICRCLIIQIVPRFHISLVEPDKRVSRIRLPKKTSRFCSRKAARPLSEPDKTKSIVQDVMR